MVDKELAVKYGFILGEESIEAEMGSALEFISRAVGEGYVPARKPYLKNRDEEFIGNYRTFTESKIGKIKRITKSGLFLDSHYSQDAREAIFIGQKLGYRDEDIAAFLRRNYILDRNYLDERFVWFGPEFRYCFDVTIYQPVYFYELLRALGFAKRATMEVFS